MKGYAFGLSALAMLVLWLLAIVSMRAGNSTAVNAVVGIPLGCLFALALVLMVVPANGAELAPREQYRVRVVERINDVRGPNVHQSKCLQRHAQARARALVGRPLEHVDASVSASMYRCGADRVGEVIGRLRGSPALMVRAWMVSDGHRKVLLDKRYHRVGVGVVRDRGMWLVVVHFADKVK